MTKKPRARQGYIANIQGAYDALRALKNYRKLDHHGKLEQTLLKKRRLDKGTLIDILQLAIIHDLHAERDPRDGEKQFEPEYARCITSLDDEFETRLQFVDTLMAYARGSGKAINGKSISRWRAAKRELKDLRKMVKDKRLDPSQAQRYFADNIAISRENLIQFNLYLSQAYHFPNGR